MELRQRGARLKTPAERYQQTGCHGTEGKKNRKKHKKGDGEGAGSGRREEEKNKKIIYHNPNPATKI